MRTTALSRREKLFLALAAAAALVSVGLAVWCSAPLAAPASSGLVQTEKPLMDAVRVDLNTAGPAALQTLPGVGEQRAKALIAYRLLEHGPFDRVEDAAQVPGIPAEAVAQWQAEGLAYVS